MKIVIFTMSMERGGAERVIANLCNEYLVYQNKITVITCIKGKDAYPLNKSVKRFYLDQREEEKGQGKARRFLRRRNRLKKILDTLQADIMLNILPEPSFLALSLKEKYTFPMVVSVRSDPAMEYTFLPYRMLMLYFYPKAEGLILQTERAREYFPVNIRKKSVVIPNPIHRDAVRKSFEGKRKKEIVAVGRLIPEKNYLLLLQAYKKISKRFPDYKLVIYGSGPLKQKLSTLIKRWKLECSVQLAGQKDDVYDRIYQASLFVMSSDHEGMPNALMEAMALGLPVVATDCPCGGPAFLIKNGFNGILVKPKDAAGLASAMEMILSHPELARKLGRHAGEIAQSIAPEKIYRQWGMYLNKIAEGKNKYA